MKKTLFENSPSHRYYLQMSSQELCAPRDPGTAKCVCVCVCVWGGAEGLFFFIFVFFCLYLYSKSRVLIFRVSDSLMRKCMYVCVWRGAGMVSGGYVLMLNSGM